MWNYKEDIFVTNLVAEILLLDRKKDFFESYVTMW